MIKKFFLGSLELREKEIVFAGLETQDAEASYHAALSHGRKKRRESTPAAALDPLTISLILYVALLDRDRPVGPNRPAFHARAAGVRVLVFRVLVFRGLAVGLVVRERQVYPVRPD
jgi:hypothetical protein